MATWKNYVEGPRWARFGSALRNRVWADPSLKLVSCEEDKSLLTVTVRFEVEGPDTAVERLQQDILKSIDKWNRQEQT